MSIDDDAKQHLQDTIIDLIRCFPDEWTEILAAQAGAACLMNVYYLEKLLVSTTEITKAARRMDFDKRGD